jgi:hypothetical protein
VKKYTLLIAFASIFLISCKADFIEMSIEAKDVFAAAEGDVGIIEFEAKFSNFGDLDQEARTQVEALEKNLKQFHGNFGL